MEISLLSKIEIIEHIQELHQYLDRVSLCWLDKAREDCFRHINNFPRLVMTANPGEACTLVGNTAQLIDSAGSNEFLIASNKSSLSNREVFNLLAKGYQRRDSRLFQRVNLPLPPQDRLRILVLTNLYPPQELGGYGRSIYDFVSNLSQLGHLIQVVTSNAPYLGGDISKEQQVCRELQLMGTYNGKIEIIRDAQTQRLITSHNLKLLKRVLQKFMPNAALLGNLDMVGIDPLRLLTEHQIPCWHHYGFSDPEMLPFPAAYMPTKEQGYQPVANSHYTARTLAVSLNEFTPIPVIYPGAQTHFFDDLEPSPLGGPLKIAYASLLIGAKGPHILLEALARLKASGIQFQCEIAGGYIDPGFKQQLINFTQITGIADDVKFLGKLERFELRNLFERNQVFVFASTWEEPFGISQVEALAAGLLVVSSATGGAAETVHDDINGRRFRPSDSQHLAKVLEEIYQYPSQHEQLRYRGRRIAKSHFDTAKESRKLSNLMVEGVRASAQ